MKQQSHYIDEAQAIIEAELPGFSPRIGIILGSGLGPVAEEIETEKDIDYVRLPGFAPPGVIGHKGLLKLGCWRGVEVICMVGRSHFYEGNPAHCITTPIRLMKQMGVSTLILTNASGSMNHRFGIGSLVALRDHINFQFNNPLVGPNDERFGERFPPLDNAYDCDLRELLKKVARKNDIKLHEGVYVGVLGPCYETAAEIEAFKRLGGDLVGMSTVAETIVAAHAGLKVVAISTVTNFATGLKVNSHTSRHNHADVVKHAAEASEKLSRLLNQFIEAIKPHVSETADKLS